MAAEQFHNLSTYDANKEKIEDSEILERWHNMLKEGIEKGIFQDLPLYQLDIMTIGTARSLVASSSFDKSNFSVDLIINCLIRGIAK